MIDDEPAAALAELVASELFRTPPASATRLVREIRARFGSALAGVVFYGSCLRERDSRGVLDFYAIVDDYEAAYPATPKLRLLNRLLPPNVFWIESRDAGVTLRGKVAVLSASDFERASGPGALRTGVWARFSQPAIAVFTRDDSARAALLRGGVRSLMTAAQRVLPLLASAPRPGAGPGPGAIEIGLAEFWKTAFAATYANEMRAESATAIAALFDADRERYRRAARLAIIAQAGSSGASGAPGGFGFEIADAGDAATGTHVTIRCDASEARRAARSWGRRRPLAKTAYAAQLAKSAFTFGDWLPYVLWKVERHSGTQIIPSDRQRRHPFVWGWPILFRVLARRDLR